MKKLLSMLLVTVMLLSLCACGEDDIQNTNPSSSNQVNTGSTESSTTGTTEATQSTTETPTTGSTEAPTTETPTQATTEAPKPTTCSHSYNAATCTAPKTCTACGATEGSAAGHSWQNATCTAPKTCTTCGATEGSVGAHNFVNGACSVCNAADIANPNSMLPEVEYVGYLRLSGEELLASSVSLSADAFVLTTRNFTTEPDDPLQPGYSYKGTMYYSIGGGFDPYRYQITDTEIIVTTSYYEDDTGAVTLKLVLLSSGNLKITHSILADYPVGTVLYPNLADAFQAAG